MPLSSLYNGIILSLANKYLRISKPQENNLSNNNDKPKNELSNEPGNDHFSGYPFESSEITRPLASLILSIIHSRLFLDIFLSAEELPPPITEWFPGNQIS